MASEKRTRYLKKKKSRLGKKVCNADDFFYSVNDDGFQISTSGRYPKLSQRIVTLAKPFEADLPELETLYSIAIIAWNVSIVPSMKETIPLPSHLSDSEKEECLELIDVLIERKKELFPFDDRIVTNFHFNYSDASCSLVVMSTCAT